MSEAETYNPFDADNFEATSKLNGRRGVITEAEFIRHNYNGKADNDSTALSVSVKVEGYEKPSNNLYSAGSLFPSEEPTTLGSDGKPKGGPQALRGPFLTGGNITKQSNVASFLAELKSTTFPMKEFLEKGAKALVGADITWKSLEKKAGKETKSYDVPAEFHGFVSIDKDGETSSSTPEASAAVDTQALVDATVAALKANGGSISRSQLSIRVGSQLPKEIDRSVALSYLLKDEFLSTVPGTTYDKKTLILNQ